MDTRFSVAVHALILIAESDVPLTSEQIAASAGVNPSYIRKVLTLLRNTGIISAHRGIRGFAIRIKSLCHCFRFTGLCLTEICRCLIFIKTRMTGVLSAGI